MRMGIIISCAIYGTIIWGFTGCGAKIDLWGAKLELPEGFDTGIKMNSIDTVDDRRGVNSKEGNYVKQRIYKVPQDD